MKCSLTEQDKDDFLIQMIAWAGLIVYLEVQTIRFLEIWSLKFYGDN